MEIEFGKGQGKSSSQDTITDPREGWKIPDEYSKKLTFFICYEGYDKDGRLIYKGNSVGSTTYTKFEYAELEQIQTELVKINKSKCPNLDKVLVTSLNQIDI